jgi:hypothetical protein
MGPRRTLDRTRTDEERIEHLAEADGNGERVVELDIAIRPWAVGTVVSAVQVQRLDGRSPADAMAHGGTTTGPEAPHAMPSRRSSADD